MKPPPRNLPASIASRLAQIALREQRPKQELFELFAMERFLYRLSKSRHAGTFVLKGGLVFHGWGIPLGRATRDIDLQAQMPETLADVGSILGEICQQAVEPDGLVFEAPSIRTRPITADFSGVRARFAARLARVQIPMQIDVSTANVITPAAVRFEYSPLLDLPPPQLDAYPKETVLAEKLEAIVSRGMASSRVKDYYDLWMLSQEFNFDGSTVVEAIAATFRARQARIPEELPPGLSDEFVLRGETLWTAFWERTHNRLPGLSQFEPIVRRLRDFLLPPLHAAARAGRFRGQWTAGQSWQP
jgi:predicted nucleotidyltransferase component of viral defense system